MQKEVKEELTYGEKCINSLKFPNRKARRLYAKYEKLNLKDLPTITKNENEKDLKNLKVFDSFSYQKELQNFYKKYPKLLKSNEE